jgi:predicted nuclease with TOPRIM domain
MEDDELKDFEKLVILRHYVKVLKSRLIEHEQKESPLIKKNNKLIAENMKLQDSILKLKLKYKTNSQDEKLICENYKLKQRIDELEKLNL